MIENPLGTKEQREELRHECEVGSDMTLAQAKEALRPALDGLDIKDDQIAVLVEALERFSLWLEQECTRGTLDLGFGPDWSATKVELALDRLLADLPAAARERAEERERLRGVENLAQKAVSLYVRWNRGNEKGVKHENVVVAMMMLRAALVGEKAK